MDSTLLAGILTAVGTIAGAYIGKSGILNKPFKGSKSTYLIGKWESTWIDLDDPFQKVFNEHFFLTVQKGSKISGYIIMDDELDKRWEFEGNFSGRFLQINYFPSKEAENKLFLDYGCYFFDMLGDGSFDGYSVGYYWNDNKISVSKHKMKRKKI